MLMDHVYTEEDEGRETCGAGIGDGGSNSCFGTGRDAGPIYEQGNQEQVPLMSTVHEDK